MTPASVVSERGIGRLVGAVLAVALGGAALLADARSALAEEKPTREQIIDALRAPHLTRCPHSITGSGCGGAGIDNPQASKPHIELEILFANDSATLDPSARAALAALSEALGKPEMKGLVLLLAGHTDGNGDEDYNRRLSERRADAVKRLLVEEFKLPADTLVAVGFGKQRLKNVTDPLAGENRRVEIVEMQK